MQPPDALDRSPTNTVGDDEDDVDQRKTVIDQLRHRPTSMAQRHAAPWPPMPPRWTLRTIRAQVLGLGAYTLRGGWRVLQRCNGTLRSARLRMSRPAPEYASNEAILLGCVQAAARAPTKQVVLFLDDMG